METVKSATVKKDVKGKKAVKAVKVVKVVKATKVMAARKDKKKVTEAELWAMVRALPRGKYRCRQSGRNGRHLREFTDEKGVVDTAALAAAVAAAKRL
tara:strand:- start:37 stop:330 length:294 start_codon:yes stop_codon:yes gene_type:complete